MEAKSMKKGVRGGLGGVLERGRLRRVKKAISGSSAGGFWLHFGAKMGAKWGQNGDQNRIKIWSRFWSAFWSEKGAKREPRGAQMEPKWSQNRPQEASEVKVAIFEKTLFYVSEIDVFGVWRPPKATKIR